VWEPFSPIGRDANAIKSRLEVAGEDTCNGHLSAVGVPNRPLNLIADAEGREVYDINHLTYPSRILGTGLLEEREIQSNSG